MELLPCLICVALGDVVERYGFGRFDGAVYFVVVFVAIGDDFGGGYVVVFVVL